MYNRNRFMELVETVAEALMSADIISATSLFVEEFGYSPNFHNKRHVKSMLEFADCVQDDSLPSAYVDDILMLTYNGYQKEDHPERATIFANGVKCWWEQLDSLTSYRAYAPEEVREARTKLVRKNRIFRRPRLGYDPHTYIAPTGMQMRVDTTSYLVV